ncbi:site-specific DNA-methyltransferase [Salmonella enterica subsp. enterica]|nr:site-specific DNA-methyltransferase [Salmonella enterica subsp. enterica serovar Enteritidis]ECQ6652207.1 site-specific DNA-methyltransferase [Salmonella enterica subsp. enterica serovar Enteritidis]EEE8453538.1 site-specific DNA-methyltransferase [Salmonella enterica subsp. enterica serovar Enteritidis]
MDMQKETLFSEVETANSKQLAVLKANFPQCFDKNGAFIQEKLLEIVKSSDVELSKESYSLNWLGKSYARLLANLPPKTLLTEDKDHNQRAENKNSQNLLIKGDNLEVLKHMVNAYTEKVKMIYIDPPYNTGSDGFVYNDDRKFTPEQLSELAGIDLDEATRILDFTVKGSSSHSAWLTFMYPRLYIARELLREDGVIFISIDDNEDKQLGLLCDEVFGQANFVAKLPTIMNLKGNHDNFGFSDTHEYIYVYAKNKDICHLGQFDIDESEVEKEWDEDEYGLFKRADTLKRTGQDASRKSRPKGWFPVFINSENKVYATDDDKPLHEDDYVLYPVSPTGEELSWSWGKRKINDEHYNLIVIDIKDGKNIYKKQRPALGDLPTKKPKSIWYKPEYSTSTATTELKNLLGDKLFEGPKPVPLISDLIKIGTEKDSLVLDFFAGSGTTAEAVAYLNNKDSGCRNFICIQKDEDINKTKNAYSIGYRSIFEITKKRIQEVFNKIPAASDNTSNVGFKIIQTIDDFREKDESELTLSNHTFFDDVVLTPEQYDTLLTTWCVYDGSLLTTPIEDVDLNGYKAHLCDGRLYLIAPNFTSEALKALLQKLDMDKDFAPNKVVFYGSNFESAKQMELNEALKSYANKKSIDLDLVVRN